MTAPEPGEVAERARRAAEPYLVEAWRARRRSAGWVAWSLFALGAALGVVIGGAVGLGVAAGAAGLAAVARVILGRCARCGAWPWRAALWIARGWGGRTGCGACGLPKGRRAG